MKTDNSSAIAGAILLALALAACGGSSSKTFAATSAAATTTSSSTTSSSTAPSHPSKKAHKVSTKPKKKHAATTTTTSTTTTSTRTSSTTTTTTHSTTTTSTTAQLVRPLQATLVGANHDPTIKVKWAYTVTATDAKGHPLSGTIETEFTLGGTVVGKETPFKHTFKDGKITNTVTFPAQSLGVSLQLQVVVITSIGTEMLDWPVKPKK